MKTLTFHTKWECLQYMQFALSKEINNFIQCGKRAEQWLEIDPRFRPHKTVSDSVEHMEAWKEDCELARQAFEAVNRNNINDPELTGEAMLVTITAAIDAFEGEMAYETKRWRRCRKDGYSATPEILRHYRAAAKAFANWSDLPDGSPK